MKDKILLFIFCFFSLIYILNLNAQDNLEAADEDKLTNKDSSAETTSEAFSPDKKRIDLEIKTSTLAELAAWCRTLGLSEGGTRNDLSRRLRDYFKLPESREQINENQKIMTIQSARTTEYFKIEVVNEDYARLTGEVHLELKDKDSKHTIIANDILFNRTRNIITARGGVEYIKVKGDSTETFRGENITVNIDNWSSVFLDGKSEKKIEGDSSAYFFSGTVITRTDEDVMILNKAKITNAKDANAYWSINASKVWLLPGSDFAIFNAVLKVGEVPVMYIPFFYYPADEVIFHPTIGYRSREGAFVQTTTYLMGRPKANKNDVNSLSKILGNSNDMEKERQGIFLRSTGKPTVNTSSTSLKAMIDYYTNLGGHFGIEYNTPKIGILNAFNLNLSLGFTRTVTETNGQFTPYAPNYDGTSDWNDSNLFSMVVPFRYRFKTDSGFNGKYGGLSWNITLLSDPYIESDFSKRSEDMDWFNMIQQGVSALEDEITLYDIQSYYWQLTGSLRPSVQKLSPYLSSLSLSSISATMNFKTIEDYEISKANRFSPNRFFFAPDNVKLNITGSASGTPLTIAGGSVNAASGSASSGNSASGNAAYKTEAEPIDPLKDIGIPRSPWLAADKEEDGETSAEDKLKPPVLSQRFEPPKAGSLRFIIDYQLSPTSSSELQFRSGYNNWTSFDDVDWNEVQSLLTSIGGSGNINFNMNHSDNIFSNKFSFTGSGTYRDYLYISEDAEAYLDSNGEFDRKKEYAARESQYRQTHYLTSYSYTGSLRPLYKNTIFSQSNLQYSFGGTLVKSKFTGTGENPEWEPVFGAWDKDYLEKHTFAANLAANVMEKNQTISFNADIPPKDASISANATFRVWVSDTTVRVRVKNPGEPDIRIIEPVHFSETLKFSNISTITSTMILDPEQDNEVTSVTASLSLWNFRANFNALKMRGYTFKSNDPNPGGEWVLDTEPSLNPKDLSLNYNRTFSNVVVIKDWVKFSSTVNTSLNFDLQKYTSSNFRFIFSLNLGITDFLDLTLSSTSQNDVIFRYFKNVSGMEDLTSMYIEGEQNNLFIDLFDSFNFTDETKRRRSGFKLKSFSFKALHKLGDWNAELGIVLSTDLERTSFPPKYEIYTDVSFSVKWVPISEIKTDIKYDKKTDKYTVQ